MISIAGSVKRALAIAGPVRGTHGTASRIKPAGRFSLALERPELSPRELAVTFTDERAYFVSESSVYRLLKARDLLKAIQAAAPERGFAIDRAAIRPIMLPETAEPTEVTTLIEALAAHVRMHSERAHLWLWSSGANDQCITYGELDRVARAVAGSLSQLGLQPGDRVAISCRPRRGFSLRF
jgi:non-ribosomal peptide synthetase component F